MKILVACEYSGRVRDAFKARGHCAVSCDILPSSAPGRHSQCDVIPLLTTESWDMMIAFPPCTHLAVSGARYFAEKRADGRQQQGIDFFMALADAPIPRKCIENPVGIMSTQYRKPDQIIQPYQFGHPESKRTCLWLTGLPLLTPTKVMKPQWYQNPDGTEYRDSGGQRYSPSHYSPQAGVKARWDNQTPSGQNRLRPSSDRAKIRSLTYQGIADAMAAQWG